MKDGTAPPISYLSREIRIMGPSNDDPNLAAHYKNTVTGNRHENMPLDSQLFADVCNDLSFNIAATHMLPKDDEKKFHFDSYTRASSAMRRTVMNISSKRIIEDCNKRSGVIDDIIAHEGAKLPGNKANGKRFYSKDEAMLARVERLHPDAKVEFEKKFRPYLEDDEDEMVVLATAVLADLELGTLDAPLKRRCQTYPAQNQEGIDDDDPETQFGMRETDEES